MRRKIFHTAGPTSAVAIATSAACCSSSEALPVDSPLRSLPNVLLTPHQAAATVECYFEMGAITAGEIERWVAGQPLRYELSEAALARMS